MVKYKQEIKVALKKTERFGSLSDLKLNRDKTEGIWLGNLKSSRDKYDDINWSTKPIKCLGVCFWHNKIECEKLNLEKPLTKSEKNYQRLV